MPGGLSRGSVFGVGVWGNLKRLTPEQVFSNLLPLLAKAA